MYREDTIAAIATPPGEGGVAIVRVSGPDAERIANEIFVRARGRNGRLRSHVLHHGLIRDPETGATLDEVLLTVMRKPASYTGEDVVEVHCHGGPVLVRQVLELVLSRGARHAAAGEFTKRAFLNGRLDLAQAEAVLDLIQARTAKGARVALEQARGQLSAWIKELREEMIEILAEVEAAIDFPEEELELLDREALGKKIAQLGDRIGELIASYQWGRLYREGARVCIAGRPNVGKSSLLNLLLGEERVIVTPEPGTTRDVIEESINLGGVPIVLWDTAGIRETENSVEKIGVEFTLRRLEAADAVLVVLDGAQPLAAEDIAVLDAARSKKTLVAINKTDLPIKLSIEELKRFFNSATVFVSAKTGAGLADLKRALKGLLLNSTAEPEIVITNSRHSAALKRAQAALAEALKSCHDGHAPELIAVDLYESKAALEEIVGTVANEDILEHIFAKFCIGK
ncbi:MAG TPA: tRNA uridine-5-carboxymethylaminomethyl(34) synthesis GTPase MnmE [Candidatus Acidoferrales bacterium]|nr:tRNA uridine-5-carboxymethylaminomethyl(34) synthesis GTPase MnmE [Candidatus Acidoferrales bacterium]